MTTEGTIAVPKTTKKLDTTTVINSAGEAVEREVVVVADPMNLAAYARVTNSHTESDDYGMVTRPVLPMDAFGRLRVSNPQTLFDSQLQYDEMDIIWKEKLTSSGTVTHDADASLVNMNTTTSSGSAVIRQSSYVRYQPGKSQQVFMTFGMVDELENCRKRAGYFDAENGLFIELDGSTLNLVLRSKITGSVVETRIAQADWNHDPHLGSGPSGMTLDITKSQILFIDLEWLSVGTVRVGFFHNGMPHVAHEFHNANVNDKGYMTTANLPVRYEIENTGTTASNGLMYQICSSVNSEGGFSTDLGFEFAAGNGITTIAVTTRRAILSIRPKATFNSIVNRGLIVPEDFGFFPQTEAGFLEVVYNGALGGTPDWNSVNDDSIVEFDIAGTTVTGGIVFAQSHADAGGLGSKQFSGRAAGDLAARYPLDLDIDGNNPTHMSLVITAMASTCNAVGHMGWKEIR